MSSRELRSMMREQRLPSQRTKTKMVEQLCRSSQLFTAVKQERKYSAIQPTNDEQKKQSTFGNSMSMSIPQLKQICRQHGLVDGGSKKVLIERLQNYCIQAELKLEELPAKKSQVSKKRKKGAAPPPQAKKKVAIHNQAPKLTKAQKERAAEIHKLLDHIYPDPPCPLDHSDSFTLLCAVLMSAQTTDGKVNQVSRELFKVAPTPKAMSMMSAEDVLKIIRSLGLAPTKSKNLVAMAKKLEEDFNGKVPQTFEELESLPGVGHKTASVVMSQAFGMPAFPVDTHIARLAVRWGLSNPPKNKSEKDSTSVNVIERDLKALFPMESWNKLHLQIIYYGREYCSAKLHETANCPICCWISTHKKGGYNQQTTFDLKSFTPRKRIKNIITYSDRKEELNSLETKNSCSLKEEQANDGVTNSKYFSPTVPSQKKKKYTSKRRKRIQL
eukprot:CAMPEP_0117744066 /NCGR_PEP_ID=MMETSP0947-20121206/6525_1 /TAXON_ID=44440 /ORGANISM="Chattonella subsalsa, Strain CCMP2191" /LENGTH=441 /DNA_ID=CAMNT_0005560919 /DNA_START=70 /DNA_END=1395 /DNA_ORIENTATION=-